MKKLFTDHTLNKGRRLLEDNRVKLGTYFEVQGDNDVYSVFTDADPFTKSATWIRCSCPAEVFTCSHSAAVLLMVLEYENKPFPVDDVADYVCPEVSE